MAAGTCTDNLNGYYVSLPQADSLCQHHPSCPLALGTKPKTTICRRTDLISRRALDLIPSTLQLVPHSIDRRLPTLRTMISQVLSDELHISTGRRGATQAVDIGA